MTEPVITINRNTSSAEVVLLVGAGISIPVDIPAMHGMYKAFLNKASSDITPEEKATCSFITEKLGVAEDLEEFLLTVNAVDDFKSSSLATIVERTISPRKGTKLLSKYQRELNEHIKDIIAVRKRILDFMSKTCFKFDRDKACNIFGSFVDAISQKGYPVYSTNYDAVLEHVAMERKIAVEDNFPEQGRRYLWNPNVHFSLGEVLTLIKLHGSVTWYADEEDNIEKIYYDTNKNSVGDDVERLVVFPTRFKDIYDQHFFALYHHFLFALSRAQVLIILGHSLRDDYIRAAVIERTRREKFKIIVVDPVFPNELPTEFRPARLGTTGKVTHVPFKFEEFSDELAHLLHNSTPSELASGCASIVYKSKIQSNKIKMRGNIGSLKPGDAKTFTANIDAYLLSHNKPAYVRVWLTGQYTNSDNVVQKKISSLFLDGGKIEVGSGLTGMVQEEIPIRVEIPKYSEWLKYGAKVTLHVALMQKSVNTPSQIKTSSILAQDKRELMYIQ